MSYLVDSIACRPLPADALCRGTDQDAFGLEQSKGMNVIGSYIWERDCREKPVSTFSLPAPWMLKTKTTKTV